MTPNFTAYIDEAGDEGFGKLKIPGQRGGQSSWLIIGAMIVQGENHSKVPNWKRSIAAKFPNKKSRDLHWRTLHHDQRVVVADALSSLPIHVALTLSHKIRTPGGLHEKTFKKPGFLYNYLTRWLLERLIDWCERNSHPSEQPSLQLVFSKRKATNYDKMKEYLRHLASGYDNANAKRPTNWSALDIEGIEVEDHSQRAGLQLADLITSAFFTAVEYNHYGNTEPAYARKLIAKLITGISGHTRDTGLTIVPGLHGAKPDEQQRAFLDECWRGQTPGP